MNWIKIKEGFTPKEGVMYIVNRYKDYHIMHFDCGFWWEENGIEESPVTDWHYCAEVELPIKPPTQ